MSFAVQIAGVSKRFRLYHEKYMSLKERVIHAGRIPYEDFWALTDIDLEVHEGETMGLLGHNGSGKSTLLKCVAGILQPTSGQITIRGRVAALLDLGAGFHPDLSGRENVFLNAAILGLSKRDIEKRFDEIVAFAELQQFIDNQVKYYSSGMYVRLGFAVAVNVDPDILLVDEVLAVGDELFQRKCLDRVRQFQREGRTIVFVTHGADLTRQICNRVAVLDQGHLVALGNPGEAVRAFREHLLTRKRMAEADVVEAVADPVEVLPDGASAAVSEAASVATESERRTKAISIESVVMHHAHEDERSYLLPGESLDITVGLTARDPVDDVVFGIAIYDTEGNLVFGSSTKTLGHPASSISGKGEVVFRLRHIPLLDGTYPITIGIHSVDEGTVYDWQEQQYHFEVANPGRSVGRILLPMEVTVRGDVVPVTAT